MFIFDKLDDVTAYEGTMKAANPYQAYMKRKLKMGKSSNRLSMQEKSFAIMYLLYMKCKDNETRKPRGEESKKEMRM